MIVPSVTVSPSCGIVMSANVKTPSGECEHRLTERLGERRVRLDELARSRRAWLPSSPTGSPGRAARSPTGPTMWTPRIRPARPSGSCSPITFTSPSVSPRMRARLLPPKGSCFTTTSMPASLAPCLGHARRTPPPDGSRWPRAPCRSRPGRRLAEDLLDHQDRLGKTDVSELRRRRSDRRPRRLHRPSCASIRRLGHEAPLVELDAGPVGEKPVGERAPADRHHDRRRPRASRHRRGSRPCRSPFGSWLFTTTPVRTSIPRRRERPYDDVGHIRVAARQDLRQRLEQGDLDTEVEHHRSELAADCAAADHRRRLRKLTERQHLVRGLDVAAVHVKSWQGPRNRSRRQHDVLGAKSGHGSLG